MDLDGDLDVVVSNDAPDRKLLYRNDGKGGFTESGTFGDLAWSTRYVTLADLNADRYPDVVVANRRGRYTRSELRLLQRSPGRFPSCEPLPTESATSIVAADFDGHSAIDLFVPHRAGARVCWCGMTAKAAFLPNARWHPLVRRREFRGPLCHRYRRPEPRPPSRYSGRLHQICGLGLAE